MKAIGFVLIAALLAGCGGANLGPEPLAVVRRDGQTIDGNRVLADRFETDRMICLGETQKASLSGSAYVGGGLVGQAIATADRGYAADDVMRGCMAEKGYAIVPKSQEASAEAHFRSLQLERAKVETGSISR